MAQLTEEEIRKMSPEQILQLQKQNCVFCQIISGKIPAKKVYETQNLIGLLDINPASPGHVILLTKEHYQIMPLIPDELIGDLFVGAKLVSQSMLKALAAQGTTIFAANGTVAGQRAPHFMLHVIPRAEGDDVSIAIPALMASQDSVAAVLTSKIREAFGYSGGDELPEKEEGKKPEEKNEQPRQAKPERKKEEEKVELVDSEKAAQPADKLPSDQDEEDGEGSHVNLDELTDFMFKGSK